MIDENIIRKAARLLVQAAPGSKVILFGSQARRESRADSDLDFLVVEPKVSARRAEMVRLRNVLRPLRVPVDVLVVSKKIFDEWRETPNTVIYEAAREGQVLNEMA